MHAQAEFGVVLEEGVLPGRTVAFGVLAERRGREGGAVDRRAARGVGDHHAVAEELGDGLDVRGLAATGAGTRELEERLGELRVLDIGGLGGDVFLVAHVGVQVIEVGLFGSLAVEALHHEGLLLGRAHVGAVAATRAVERRDLHREGIVLELGDAGFALDALRGFLGLGGGHQERTDGGVRADEGALVALDAVGRVPLRNHDGRAALLIGCRTGGNRTVHHVAGEGAHRKVVAVLGGDHVGHVADEFGSQALVVGVDELAAGIIPGFGDLDLDIVAAAVHGRIVHLDHVLALLAVGLVDGFLHVSDGLFVRDDAGDLEEGALQDRVGAAAQADLSRDLGGVDQIEADVLVHDGLLHEVRDALEGLLGVPEAVEQQRTAVLDALEHIVFVEIGRHVAGHEVGRGHQVRRMDRLVAETQVRAGVAAGFLGVVVEVALAVFRGMVADDLDGVLVGAHGAVAAQAEELALVGAFLDDGDFFLERERLEGHVIDDADGEAVLGFAELEVVEHGDDLGRAGILGGEAVAAADEQRGAVAQVGQDALHVEVERFAQGAGFLGAVEHGDALGRLGQGPEEIFGGERTVETDGDQAELLTAGLGEIVDGFLDGLGDRAHGDDDMFGIRCAVVVEWQIVATGQFADLTHIAGDDVGNGIVIRIGGFPCLEEHVRVLVRTAGNGLVGIEGLGTELREGLVAHQRTEVFGLEHLDLLDLMGGAETVEEVHERHARLEGGQMGHGGQVHGFLHAGGGQHREAGLTDAHHVLVVAEDGKGLGGQGTGRHVENGRKQFAGDLVHVGDHQQQTLGGGEGGGQAAGLQGTMHGAGGTAFALHLGHLNDLAEHILLAESGPLVHEFRHRRRRGNRIDGRVLTEQIRHVSRGEIAITSDEFFFFCHTTIRG